MMFRRILAAALAVFVFCVTGPVAQAQVIPAQSATVLAGAKKDLYPTAVMALDFAGVGTGGTPWYKAGGAISTQPSTLRGYTFSRALAAYAEGIEGKLTLFPAGSPRVTNKGVLIEEARTNVLLQSTTLANFGVLNAANTTDGTLSLTGNPARKVTSLTAAATSFNYNIAGGAAAGANTVSVYARRGSGSTDANTFALRNSTTATVLVAISINYDTGVFSYSAGSSGAVVTPMANGWWRISLTSASFSAGDGLQLYAAFQGNAEGAGEYAYLADAQGEGGAFVTSYIPTTSAAVTRPADVFYYAGGTFPSTATIVATFQIPAVPATTYKTLVGGGVGLPSMSIGNGSSNVVSTSNRSVVSTASTANTYNPAVVSSAASRASSGANAVALDGAMVSTSAATYTMATSGSLGIGYDVVSANNQPNGYIQRILIYPFAMSDAQLQAATMPGETSALRLDFARGTYKNAAGYVRTNSIFPTTPTALPGGTDKWNATWASSASTIVANDGLAPDGTTTAARITTTGANEGLYFRSAILPAANSQWTASFWVFVTAQTTVTLNLNHTGGTAWTSIANDTQVVPANTWTRVWITRTAASSVTATSVTFALTVPSSGTSFWIWRGQAEPQAYPSSNIVTTTASASVTTYSSTNPADVGNMTFTRASTGYAEDASGNLVLFGANVPRITNKGVLIEPAATNLLPYSFNDTPAQIWDTLVSSTVSTGSLAPRAAGATSTRMTLTAVPGRVQRNITVPNDSLSRTFSVDVEKKAVSYEISAGYAGGTGVARFLRFDGATGNVTAAPFEQYAVVDKGAWWRVSLTATNNSTGNVTSWNYVGLTSGSVGDTVEIALPDYEVGTIATSYKPSRANTNFTRSADVFYYTGLSVPASFSMAMSGIIPTVAPSSYYHVAGFDTGTGADAALGYYHNGGASAAVDINSGGVTQANFNATGKTVGAVGAIAIRVSANAFGGSFDGGAAQQDAAGTAPSPTILRIGQGTTGTANHFRSYVQRVALYPYAANDNELPYRSAGNF